MYKHICIYIYTCIYVCIYFSLSLSLYIYIYTYYTSIIILDNSDEAHPAPVRPHRRAFETHGGLPPGGRAARGDRQRLPQRAEELPPAARVLVRLREGIYIYIHIHIDT